MMLKNPVLTIEGESYTGQATAAELVPDVPTEVTKTLDPATVVVDVDTASWVFNFTVIQGSDLHELLLTTAPGTALDVIYQIEPGSGKRKYTFSAASMPTNYGGERGAGLVSSVSLQVLNQPTPSVSS